MPDVMTRADATREFLTGAASAGGSQASPSSSLGNYRSSTEVASLGITIDNAIANAAVDFVSGLNGEGVGILTAPDTTHLTWTPPGGSVGSSVAFSGVSDQKIVEGSVFGKFVRITGSPPFSVGASQITLAELYNNLFGFDDVAVADATAGITQYRASMIYNVSALTVTAIQRWIASLGTAVTSTSNWLSGSGSGTIVTTGSLLDWPDAGWAQVRNSGGTLKEVVYYTSRSATTLTIPAAGRALLGTSATAGANTDVVTPVPGIAIGIDTAGAIAASAAIQTIANQTTAPTAVTWNLGITAATGLQIGTLTAGQQMGVWYKRHIPAGAIATPKQKVKVNNRFTTY